MGEKRYIISDASKMLNVESHVLRYWEEELEIKIPRNEMGHRYYTEGNIESLRKVRDLKKQGYSLKAIKNMVNPKKGARENKESNERLTVRQPISLMEVREKKAGVENCYQGSAGGNVRQCTECGTEYDTE
ncbi:MAG: MerR family transcriptional regulator [Eubacterium ventriosum]